VRKSRKKKNEKYQEQEYFKKLNKRFYTLVQLFKYSQLKPAYNTLTKTILNIRKPA